MPAKKAKSSPTLHDVAKAAGVSIYTVSRSFTEGASVAKKTRERVLAIADELGYRPNAIARAMISGKSKLIAVFVAFQVSISFTADFNNNFLWFFTGMIYAVIRLAREADGGADGEADGGADGGRAGPAP